MTKLPLSLTLSLFPSHPYPSPPLPPLSVPPSLSLSQQPDAGEGNKKRNSGTQVDMSGLPLVKAVTLERVRPCNIITNTCIIMYMYFILNVHVFHSYGGFNLHVLHSYGGFNVHVLYLISYGGFNVHVLHSCICVYNCHCTS